MEARAEKNEFLNNISSIFTNLENIQLPISIFKVPSSLASANPEAYIPRLVGLGPYHHLRPELQQIQMCKLNEAKNIHEGFQCVGFDRLVRLLHDLVGPSIRACYSTYLEMDDEVLVTVMTIDGLFLFEMLCFYGVSRDELAKSVYFRRLVYSDGRRLVQDMTCLRESMMLENQIPILVLKVLMLIECSHLSEPSNKTEASEVVKKLFPQMLLSYCKAVSPLALLKKYPDCRVMNSAHLLDLLYSLIVLKETPCLEPGEEEREERFLNTISIQLGLLHSDSLATPTSLPIEPLSQRVILSRAVEIASDIPQLGDPVRLVASLLELPWTELCASMSSAVANSHPEEETFIPRASQLYKAGIEFCRTDHITAIKFDSESISLHLPLIRLDENSEVVIKNLAVYEVMVKSDLEQLIFTRYVKIMSGIIRTVEDVTVLKEKGILEFESINEAEVVEVFKGTRKAPRLTNTEDLDRAIEQVNEYYNSLWKVSAKKVIKKWRSSTWNFCRAFAILVIFALLVLHTFCTVYGCTRFFFKSRNGV